MRFITNEELRSRLSPETQQGKGEWVDLAGLIAPKKEVDELLDDIESGRIASVGTAGKRIYSAAQFVLRMGMDLGMRKD